MAQKIQKSVCKKFSGYCPHLDKENTIFAEYAQVIICDTVTLGYKLIHFKCQDIGECKLNHECPLWKIALRSKP